MNLIGGPKTSVIGAVDDVIGASFSHNSTVVTDAAIGPTPDDPVIVTCGALYRASLGSNRSFIAFIWSPASPSNVAMMKIPLSCTSQYETVDKIGTQPTPFTTLTPARMNF